MASLIPDLIIKTVENIYDRYRVNQLEKLNKTQYTSNGVVNQSFKHDEDHNQVMLNIRNLFKIESPQVSPSQIPNVSSFNDIIYTALVDHSNS